MDHWPIQQKNDPLTTEIAILNWERMAHWNFNFIGNKWKMAHTMVCPAITLLHQHLYSHPTHAPAPTPVPTPIPTSTPTPTPTPMTCHHGPIYLGSVLCWGFEEDLEIVCPSSQYCIYWKSNYLDDRQWVSFTITDNEVHLAWQWMRPF